MLPPLYALPMTVVRRGQDTSRQLTPARDPRRPRAARRPARAAAPAAAATGGRLAACATVGAAARTDHPLRRYRGTRGWDRRPAPPRPHRGCLVSGGARAGARLGAAAARG